MVRDPAGAGRAVSTAGVPLLIVAELPSAVQAWADALRRAHYPPERNRLGAHVTLFHGLPPSAHDEIVRLLGDLASMPPPSARVTGIMDLGRGTAFAVDSPGMVAVHADIAERLHGLIQQKDTRPLRLHITVQNKVSPGEARALQAELAATTTPRAFRFRGFGLYGWTGDLWRRMRVFVFRGRN